MKIEKTNFEDVLILTPNIFEDERGFFSESYSEKTFLENGIDYKFIQDAHSFNKYKNTFRGLHYQMNPKSQAKIVRVLTGEIIDFIVDIRKKSPTYGQYISQTLSSKNHKQVLIPKGFAHGFLTTTDNVNVLYKMDNFYDNKHERTLNLQILNMSTEKDIIISDKDKNSPCLENIDNNFIYEGIN